MRKNLKLLYSKYFRFINRSNAVIGIDCEFGFKARIINRTGRRENLVIGNNVMLHGTVICEGNGRLLLNDYVNIRRDVYIGAVKNVEVGKYTIISNNVSIMDNDNHPTSPTLRLKMVKSGWSNNNWSWVNSASSSVTIAENVWICQGVRILKGCHIGENSVIAAGAVVTKSVGDNSVCAGNPGKVVKVINEK